MYFCIVAVVDVADWCFWLDPVYFTVWLSLENTSFSKHKQTKTHLLFYTNKILTKQNNKAGGATANNSGEKIDDFLIYSDEETIVSRNYLLFLEERFASKSIEDAKFLESSPSGEEKRASTGDIASNLYSPPSGGKYKPADKLIIKAKVYILEILEVKTKNKY